MPDVRSTVAEWDGLQAVGKRVTGSGWTVRVPRPRAPRPAPPNALSDVEREQVLDVLASPRFCDKSVSQTWATLLDGHLPGLPQHYAPAAARDRAVR